MQNWEHDYRAQHDRRPDRKALSGAAPHIQKSYSTYYKLRATFTTSTTHDTSVGGVPADPVASAEAVDSNEPNVVAPFAVNNHCPLTTSSEFHKQCDGFSLDKCIGSLPISETHVSTVHLSSPGRDESNSSLYGHPTDCIFPSASPRTSIATNKIVKSHCVNDTIDKLDYTKEISAKAISSEGVWSKSLNRNNEQLEETKIDRPPLSDLYSKLANNMRASFLSSPSTSMPRISLKRKASSSVKKSPISSENDTEPVVKAHDITPPLEINQCDDFVAKSDQLRMFHEEKYDFCVPDVTNTFTVVCAPVKVDAYSVNVSSAHSTKSNRLNGKINPKWMKRCIDTINDGDPDTDVLYYSDDSNSAQVSKDGPCTFNVDVLPKPSKNVNFEPMSQRDSPVNEEEDKFSDVSLSDVVENGPIRPFEELPDDFVCDVQVPCHDVDSNNEMPVCSRKRKKIDTLQELEECDKITPVWPPPKRKRISRIVKNTEEEIERHKLNIKAIKVNRECQFPMPSSSSSSSCRVRPQRTRKKRHIHQPVEVMSDEVFQQQVNDSLSLSITYLPVKHQKLGDKSDTHSAVDYVDGNYGGADKSSKLNASNENSSANSLSTDVPEYDEQLDMEKDKSRRFAGKLRYVNKNDRLASKMKSGTINENFVRIDLKKKTFVRGKKSMTGYKFRRQEWKRKQGLKTASGGKAGKAGGGANYAKNLTCFKCGDFGHWATKCPGKAKPDSILTEADRPEVSFLTLDEAADMARGIKCNTVSNTARLYVSAQMGQQSTVKFDNELVEISNSVEPDTVRHETKNLETNVDAESDFSVDSADNVCSDDEDAIKNTLNDSVRSVDMFKDYEDDDIDDHTFEMPNDKLPIDTPATSNHETISSSYVGLRKNIEPIFSKYLTQCPEEVVETLKLFGHSSFRPGQESAILRILQGKSTLLVLSTGSGKSLCYQLPAYMYAMKNKCITLCVSPLVSLMEDQVTGLPAFLHAVCLHTNQTPQQREKALQSVKDGRAHILLVSPEAVVASGGGGLLGTLMKDLPPLAFACVDEAHCVSQWSHNFRPSYLRVCSVLREQLGVRTILGLTATARHETTMSIADHLQVDDPNEGIIKGSSVPPNLQLSVSRDGNRTQALIQLLQGERFATCESIIVYCTRRDECEKVATLLRTQLLTASSIDVKANLKRNRAVSFDAESYHAGLTAYRRRTIQNRFMSGKLRIVVATVAFGMGIDKADVRAIIHYNMPQNLESYVQEIGRAGRDGLVSHCHLFLDNIEGRDVQELKRFIFVNSVDRVTVRKLLDKVFVPCTCKGPDGKFKSCSMHEVALPVEVLIEHLDLPHENILTLLCYLELRGDNLLQLLPSVYSSCTIACYGGPAQLCAVSKMCPPLAVAIAKDNQRGISHQDSNAITFPVVKIASKMGWNSGVVKRELKALEWNTSSGSARKSGVKVEFTELAFHLNVRGNLSDDDRDKILDELHSRALQQEVDQLKQLHHTHQTLRAASHASILLCSDEIDSKRCSNLKDAIGRYFAPNSNELNKVLLDKEADLTASLEANVRQDVRSLLSTHTDQTWTARAIARVFHGIQSPNFPAEVWGRVRRVWRAQINVPFKQVLAIAQQEIIKWRKL